MHHNFSWDITEEDAEYVTKRTLPWEQTDKRGIADGNCQVDYIAVGFAGNNYIATLHGTALDDRYTYISEAAHLETVIDNIEDLVVHLHYRFMGGD